MTVNDILAEFIRRPEDVETVIISDTVEGVMYLVDDSKSLFLGKFQGYAPHVRAMLDHTGTKH